VLFLTKGRSLAKDHKTVKTRDVNYCRRVLAAERPWDRVIRA
jgi:hypothetical protein